MSARWRHLLNDGVQTSDDAVFTLTLPNRGKLHALLIKVQCTNGATAGRGVTILDALDDIQILGDGSEVLYSLIPEETEKWYEALFGRELQLVQTEAAAGVQEGVFPVYFGRQLYDAELYLPLDRFTDVEVRLSFSPTISATVGFATGTFTIDVQALITPHELPLPYLGSLVTRRVKQFTSAASGDDQTELFDNTIYRAVGIYSYEAAIADGVDITRVRFEDTADGVVLGDWDWDDFIHMNNLLFGSEIVHRFDVLLQDTNTLDTRIGEILDVSIQLIQAIEAVADMTIYNLITTIAGDRITVGQAILDLVAGSEAVTLDTTDRQSLISVRGKSPTGFGLIPYMYDDSPAGYLKSADWGQLEVILTQGAAGADVRLSIQELRQF